MAVEVMYAFQNNIFIPGLFSIILGKQFITKTRKWETKNAC